MARKSAARPPQRSRGEDERSGGFLSPAMARVRENPAAAGGLLVMALTGTAILSNALFLQGSTSVTPPPATLGMSAPVAIPALAPDETHRAPAMVMPPMPRLAPRIAASPDPAPPPVELAAVGPVVLPAPTPPLPIPAAAPTPQPSSVMVPEPPEPSPEQQLVAGIQRELARLGLYSGAIDGLTGPRTASAIRAYETAAGIAPSGAATDQLLAMLKHPAPPRKAAPVVAASTAPDNLAQELDRREQERARLIAEDQQRQAAAKAGETYRAVQAALNRIGYGPVPVDGSTDARTLDAIRRFELDNGMPVTGQANDALIARLVAIGAIRPG